MYNFALAFTICAIFYIAGEWVDKLTHAWVPSVFVTAILMLLGYWFVLPYNLITDSVLLPFGATLGLFLLLVHMGTVLSLKQLMMQWRTIVICLAGLVGMCTACWFLCPLFMDRTLMITGLPALTGGIVAATIMQQAAAKAGLVTAAVFAITIYCVQGFAGYPLTAVCLKTYGKQQLKLFRPGKITMSEADKHAVENANAAVGVSHAKTILPQLPAQFDTTVVKLGKLGFVAWLATLAGSATGISGAIWALVFGVIFCTIGFLDRDALNKANSYGICMFALMMFIFDGLKDCTQEMLLSIIGPMFILIIIGVVGMAIIAFIAARILHISFYLAFANGLTALYGFPPNIIITESTCDSLATSPEEKEFLMSRMFPSMLVGGFVTVTITSVVLAGTFASFL